MNRPPLTLMLLSAVLAFSSAVHSEARAVSDIPAYADEDQDWAVAPTKTFRQASYNAPTPREIPGARVIKTVELKALLAQQPAPVLIDVLRKPHMTVKAAYWWNEVGEAPLSVADLAKFRTTLTTLACGDQTRAIVFLCLNSQCWLSYNVSLRAFETGYTNVLWYRGGTDAWKAAGLEMQQTVPYSIPP
jgi:PQQ-dependent catabolism-associated CXXCW motif protein